MSTGVVVEYAGLPGAGKSMLAGRTCAAVRAAGVPCRVADAGISAAVPRRPRRRRRLGLAGLQLVLHPVTSGRDVHSIARLVGPVGRDGVAGIVQWLAVRRLVDRAERRPGVTLLEEGPLQTAWTLALRAPPRASRAAWPLLARAGLVVVVDAPLSVVDARLSARPSRHSRTQVLAGPERVAELTRGHLLLTALLDPRRTHLRVDNDGSHDPARLAGETAAWILRVAGKVGGSFDDDPEHLPDGHGQQ